ncbi:MAG: rod shape-determining protein MreC [Saccharofermentanales bacterium]|jgi:rod shape-determining protein MreC
MKRRVPRVMVIVIVTVALLALFILTALPGTTRSRLGDFFGNIFDPLTTAFDKAIDGVGGFFTAVRDNRDLKTRIGELEDEVGRLNREIVDNKEKVKAYEELKEALNLVTRFDDSKVLGSVVLNESLGPYHDLMRIKAGRKHGLDASVISYPVVDRHSALVGRVHSSETYSSKVLPLLHEAFSVSARVDGSYRSTFRVRGDVLLREQGLCLGDNIPEGTPLKVGDLIVTSGEGGIFPGGIPIGEVVSLQSSEDGKIVTCSIKPTCDFDSLSYVFVIVENEHES